MGIFDDLKRKVNPTTQDKVGFLRDAANAITQKHMTFTFARLPESVAEMQALPEAALENPFQTAALTVCALCAYAASPAVGIGMLNFLKGPQPLSPYDQQFLRDRFMDGKYYVPFSYFEGATPANDYQPTVPYTVTVRTNPHSALGTDRVTLFVRSGGADSDRPLTLRRAGNGRYYLWEQHLLSDIRTPKSKDPWA
jgi:hypothetical protein